MKETQVKKRKTNRKIIKRKTEKGGIDTSVVSLFIVKILRETKIVKKKKKKQKKAVYGGRELP